MLKLTHLGIRITMVAQCERCYEDFYTIGFDTDKYADELRETHVPTIHSLCDKCFQERTVNDMTNVMDMAATMVLEAIKRGDMKADVNDIKDKALKTK